MRTYLRRRARRWGYRLHLITYCILCDGSINEARARGYGFTADRWRWHRRHERLSNPGPLLNWPHGVTPVCCCPPDGSPCLGDHRGLCAACAARFASDPDAYCINDPEAAS